MSQALHSADLGRRFLEVLDGSRKVLAIYPADHPHVAEGFKNLEYVLGNLFLAFGEVTLSLVEDEFFINDWPLRRESGAFRSLASFLTRRQATSLRIRPAVSADELRRLFVALNAPAEEVVRRGGAGTLARGLELPNVVVSVAVPGSLEPKRQGELSEDLKARLSSARVGYESALTSMKSIFDQVAEDGRIDYRTIKATTEALLDSVVTNRNVWTHLLNVKHNDEYTFNHSVNVATLALLLATRFGVAPDALAVLGEAALLHDLGKQKVPAKILQKAGSLTDEEWAVMRSHPERGAKILIGLKDVTEAAAMVAYEHHIRYDYKGYPRTRTRRPLHLFSHLVAVADIYDALTSDRGYRRALMPDMAMRIILTQSGTAFHPLVVKHFVNLVGMYPVGTFVRLKTGEIGLVQYNQSRDLLRPVVLVIFDATGTALPPVCRDLMEEPSEEPLIESCVDPVALGIDTERT